MDDKENFRYLPILYTIPRYVMVIGADRRAYNLIPFCLMDNNISITIPFNNKRNNVPESEYGVYVHSKKLGYYLRDFNLSIQDYYDRWFLNITVPSDRPKCPVCRKYTKWEEKISLGYRRHCGLNCSQYDLWHGEGSEEYIKKQSESMSDFYESGGTLKVIWDNLDKYPLFTESFWSEEMSNKRREVAKLKLELGIIKTFGVQYKDKNSKLYKFINGDISDVNSLKYKSNTEEHKNIMRNYAKSRKSGFGYIWDHLECLDENSDFGNNHRFNSGVYHESKKCIGRCYYRSSYELKYIEILESDDNIISYEIEPNNYKVRYYKYSSGTICTYYPDFVVNAKDGRTIIVEVKPWNLRNTPDNKSKRKECKRMCKKRGINI